MISEYLIEVIKICDLLDKSEINKMLGELKALKKRGGRLFILGIGGSAANASHAVNDFRKIAGIEAYAPTDNVAELTARINDEGWDNSLSKWLIGSKLNKNDCIMVLSVGGGDYKKEISMNLIAAMILAKIVNCKVLGIVSRDGGYTRQKADVCILIPVVNQANITPHAESFQAIIWHYLANNI